MTPSSDHSPLANNNFIFRTFYGSRLRCFRLSDMYSSNLKFKAAFDRRQVME